VRLLVVEGLDGCGKDYLMNKMLELNKMIYCVRDDCHGIQDLNEHINRLTTSRSRSLYSLLEYVFMRKIEKHTRTGKTRILR
jgi:thymidylate kinase